LALTEALEENEQLHDQVHNITTELESLRAENELLKPLADEAQYLAGVLKASLFFKFNVQKLIVFLTGFGWRSYL
jgi:Geminin